MDYGLRESAKISSPLRRSPLFSLAGLVLIASLLALVGCADFLASRDNDIRESNRAIEKARDDNQRAKAYSARGAAYSEKARYSRITKRVSDAEYERLFAFAIKDHNQAVALNPGDAEVYFNRGQAYYDRGEGDLVENKGGKSWFDAAAANFEKVIEKDPTNSRAFDMLGLAYEQNSQPDKAIQAYTREMALDRRLAKSRLATAYCYIGFQHQQQQELGVAAAAYQKSTEFGIADDKSCPYDPFGNSIEIFTTETHEYDKAWEMVYRALKMGRMVAPELLVRLQKESGRTF
jgi:tetratricopeptide (TPR) repeat protein